MTKRVYKFTSVQHGISNLQHKRLKLSTVDELNDPFDLRPVDTTDPVISQAVDAAASYFRSTAAILCLSRNWDNLLLWSHYGDSHKGVCLGLDISDGEPGNYDTDVRYQPNLLQIRRDNLEDLPLVADRLHRTKHESWSYEQEVRMYAGLFCQKLRLIKVRKSHHTFKLMNSRLRQRSSSLLFALFRSKLTKAFRDSAS